MEGNLGTNNGIHLALEGRDENSRREKRSKDDLMKNCIYLFIHHHIHSYKITMNNIPKSYLSLQSVIITIKEERSGRETSGNPQAYTERPPRRCVRTVRLLETFVL